MAFESHLNEVLNALSEARQEALNNIGTFVTAEAQLRAPVKTGNMRRSTTFDIVSDNEVDVGVTNEAPYAPYVELGTSKQRSQAFLKPAVTDNVDKLQEIAGQSISLHMGGEK
jgi:HK97 gp10 family phage protein